MSLKSLLLVAFILAVIVTGSMYGANATARTVKKARGFLVISLGALLASTLASLLITKTRGAGLPAPGELNIALALTTSAACAFCLGTLACGVTMILQNGRRSDGLQIAGLSLLPVPILLLANLIRQLLPSM